MSSRKAARVSALTDALSQRRVLHIRDAALLLDVSEMTVRRDVSENPGLFGYFGGHIVPAMELESDGPYELAKAADSHSRAKQDACTHALKYIRPDETIFIDCGTTLAHLVEMIPADVPVMAVCYALNIADRLTRKPNISVVMLGGLYHPSSASFSGSSGLDSLDELGINVAFLSAAGVDQKRGATCAYFHEAQIKRKVMSLARKNVLVTDSSKIGKLKPAFFGEIDSFDAIVTENGELNLSSAA